VGLLQDPSLGKACSVQFLRWRQCGPGIARKNMQITGLVDAALSSFSRTRSAEFVQ